MKPEYRDWALVELAYAEWSRKKNATVKFSCYNRAEANMLLAISEYRHPEMPVITTWWYD